MADQVAHTTGCPAGRSETYQAVRPGGQVVVVTRCLDCGKAVLTEKEKDQWIPPRSPSKVSRRKPRTTS